MKSKSGRICYLMGASGAGKDSLIQYLKDNLTNPESYYFARRYVTRAQSGKDDIAVNQEKFSRLIDAGKLVLFWQRHGIRYGIGKEVDRALTQGKDVIINGSRDHYFKAKSAYPKMIGILVKADKQILKQRLSKRKRDSYQEMAARLAAADKFQFLESRDSEIFIINNNESLTSAGNQLLKIISG